MVTTVKIYLIYKIWSIWHAYRALLVTILNEYNYCIEELQWFWVMKKDLYAAKIMIFAFAKYIVDM